LVPLVEADLQPMIPEPEETAETIPDTLAA